MENEAPEVLETQAADQAHVNTEITEKAIRMGWRPKEEWRGDETKWKSAEDWVKRAEEIMPIMKTQLSDYDHKVQTLQKTVESQKETMDRLIKMSELTAQQAYEKAARDLKLKQMEAVRDGDLDTWQKLEDEKEKIQKPEVITKESPPVNPYYDEWHKANNWYTSDDAMTLFADAYGKTLPQMPYQDWLKTIENKVKSEFPHKFTNPKRTASPMVDSTSIGTPESKPSSGKTYKDLPHEAKIVCDRNVEDGLFKSKDAWVAAYFAE